MDFSNESYESFESMLLEGGTPETSLRWELRDMAFSALYHDTPGWGRALRGRGSLFALPFGWVAWLYSHKLGKTNRAQTNATEADHHLLCLSSRSNHIERIAAWAGEMAAEGSCQIWVTQDQAAQTLEARGIRSIAKLGRCWIPWLFLSDILKARREAAEILRLVPCGGRLAAGKLRISFAIYLAALRYWDTKLGNSPKSVLTTYEKDPVAKAMLASASRNRVGKRIHWTHGLRHSSHRATLASELWCLTSADAKHFATRVPTGCVALHRQSPESQKWVDAIGLLPPAVLRDPPTLHFLVLGSGFDPGYTPEMSVADMMVVRRAFQELGTRVHWRFRPHPGNIARFREDISAAGFGDIDFSGRSLEEDLRWSHAVGSAFSSVAIDIEPTGRPIFWILSEIRPLYSVDQMIAEGYGTHLDAENVSRIIRETFRLN